MQYPTNVRIVRLPCSGKVDITYILRAFESGADGVIVCGCLKGGCHFVEGNLHAEDRIKLTKDILEAIGISGERVDMYFISSAMAPKFVEVIKEVTEKLSKLGPALPKKLLPTKNDPAISKRAFLYNMIKNLALRRPENAIPVPEGLEEFGKIEFNPSKCIGCKKCEEICPEKAIDSIRELDLPTILKTPMEQKDGRITKRQRFYEVLSKIAQKSPSKPISIPEGLEGFYKMQYDPKKCVFCEKCREICLEKTINSVKELDLSAITA
jgi:coenzyme F420-reducing hydrogenase delta subunit/formate hydrogenlyase subunit 6/NADH:ubiquinone oxidoreductase subunit I